MTTCPVGLSRDLAVNRVMRAETAAADMAVWRNETGALAAWDNRCPHRGMRLSHGFVRGGGLTCLYHGWRYDRSGRCALIPAHPDLEPPETIRAKAYGVAEAHGVIWVSAAGPATPPALPDGLDPLRMFAVTGAGADIAAAAAETPGPDGALPVRLGDGLLRVGGRAVALLENPVSAARRQITALVDADAPAAARRALSRWCEAMRRRAETTTEAATEAATEASTKRATERAT